MSKTAILGMYVVVLFFVMQRYYKQGGQGMPNPQVLTAPTYLYAILALAADFMGGFPIALAAGLTVALVWQATGNGTSSQTSTKKKVA